MNNNKKIGLYVIKIVAFFLLLSFLLKGIFSVFMYKDMGGGGGWQRFYQAKDNSIDVLFFGSSHAHCTVDHRILWEDYGIAGYTISAGSQNIDSTYYFTDESVIGVGVRSCTCSNVKCRRPSTLSARACISRSSQPGCDDMK